MAIKHIFTITNAHTGQDLGGYEADDEAGALDAMAREAGYPDYAAACAAAPVEPGEIVVRLESVVVPD
jgi:hypothetical protein